MPNQGQVKPLHEQVMSPTQGDSSSSRAPEMAMLRRRRSSRAGADDEELHQEDLQLVGQELVPAFQQPVAPGRDGLEVEVKGLEKALSTPTRSTTGRPDTGTGPTELEVFRSGGSKISPKEALEGPKGKPRVLAPLALPSGQPPLFTEDQLRSARAQARQAPMLYGTLVPPVSSGDDPPGQVKRPDFMKEEEKRYEVKEERKGSDLFDEGHEEEGGSYEGHQKGHGPEVFDLDQQDHLREQEEEVMWRWQISQEVRVLTELCHQQKLENTLLQQELHERRLKEEQEEKGVQKEKEDHEAGRPPSTFGTPEEHVPEPPRSRATPGDRGRAAWEPDPSILVKGLNRLTRRTLEGNESLRFRVSLARNALQVDTNPNALSVSQFATHLIAEIDQLSLAEKRSGGGGKREEGKVKKLEDGSATQKTKGNEAKIKEMEVKSPCKFYLSENGCRRGRDCKWSHDQKDEQKRCYTCGSTKHLAPSCPTKESPTISAPNSPPKVKKEKEEDKVVKGEDGEKGSGGQEDDKMDELLAEANRMLKVMKDKEASEAKLSRLHQQLDEIKKSIKTLKLTKVREAKLGSTEEEWGLLDSGATHPLRPLVATDRIEALKKVSVSLADGRTTPLLMTDAGVMVTTNLAVEPIVPLGMLAEGGCQIS